ncbi:MAG: putative metal-binding motif-containing protein [Candidatus Uhrbacteria bacterium]
MKALFIMITMIIIAGPAHAWEPEQHRVAPDDEETCATRFRASWDGCNCICNLGLVYDPITKYCQDWPFVKPLWDLSADTRTIEPTVPRQCAEQNEETIEQSGNAALDRDRDGYSELMDCDDNVFWANPSLDEICEDQIDNNCNGVVDEDACSETELPTDEDLHSAEEVISEEANLSEPIIELTPVAESVTTAPLPPTSLNLIADAGADWTFNKFLGPIMTSTDVPMMYEGWEFRAATNDDVFMAAEDMDDENQKSLVLQGGSRAQDIDHFAACISVRELNIHPGQYYLLKTAFTAPTRKELAIRLVDQDDNPITSTLLMNLSASSEWAEAEARLSVPADAQFDQANLQIGWGRANGAVELDDIQLHRLE